MGRPPFRLKGVELVNVKWHRVEVRIGDWIPDVVYLYEAFHCNVAVNVKIVCMFQVLCTTSHVSVVKIRLRVYHFQVVTQFCHH
jgi:hypothetical protein